jgi:hypothetical protein
MSRRNSITHLLPGDKEGKGGVSTMNTDQGGLNHSGEEEKEGMSMMNTNMRQEKYTRPGDEERKGGGKYDK